MIDSYQFLQKQQASNLNLRVVSLVALVFVLITSVSLPAKEKPKKTPEINPELHAAPTTSEIKMHLQNWAAEQKVKKPDQLKNVAGLLTKLESPLSSEEKLELAIQVFSEMNLESKQLIQAYQISDRLPQLSSHPLLVEGQAESFYLSNIRYYVARNLTQFRMIDQALDMFNSINPKLVIDPAGYLFFKAVCEHHLLQKEECEKSLKLLLNHTENVPQRYTQVATLMQADLADLKEESLDEISRKMSDVERRLELGNSGEKVQKVEDDIIASLDKLIKQMEDQAKSASSSSSGAGQSRSPSSGSNESRVKGQTAPGEIDKKKLSNNGGWGQLPPKKQASAKNIINRNFPSHYRKAIEKYFKKLATRKASSSN
ncbi:hypothetical protein [Gimesia aquarii]|uniref:Uncharacterized protein n=1 Tax=Gimesia aquarii TaxID=2527964 RepID=A0A517X2P1_9PLAN|nr:hypothetical protein [Gimesia aquarii]QDU11762.1 hypothetical protein V202x_51860 [Gimesia aquarii]